MQQGDNLGPLLFSLAIQPLLARLRGMEGVDLVIAYLDDIVITRDDTAVLEALTLVQEFVHSLGLAPNLQECELIPTAAGQSLAALDGFPALIKHVRGGNFKFLCSPIGTLAFCDDSRSANGSTGPRRCSRRWRP